MTGVLGEGGRLGVQLKLSYLVLHASAFVPRATAVAVSCVCLWSVCGASTDTRNRILSMLWWFALWDICRSLLTPWLHTAETLFPHRRLCIGYCREMPHSLCGGASTPVEEES